MYCSVDNLSLCGYAENKSLMIIIIFIIIDHHHHRRHHRSPSPSLLLYYFYKRDLRLYYVCKEKHLIKFPLLSLLLFLSTFYSVLHRLRLASCYFPQHIDGRLRVQDLNSSGFLTFLAVRSYGDPLPYCLFSACPGYFVLCWSSFPRRL